MLVFMEICIYILSCHMNIRIQIDPNIDIDRYVYIYIYPYVSNDDQYKFQYYNEIISLTDYKPD